MQAGDYQQSVMHTTHLHSNSIINVIKAGGNTNIKIDRLHWDTHTHIFNSGYFMFMELAN